MDIPADVDGSRIRYEVNSCEASGGLDLWAPMYAIVTCPRCGLRVSRFSEKKIYADRLSAGAPVRDAMATKVGLRWKDGRFETVDGLVLDSQSLQAYITRIAQRNNRERERKLELLADIEQYELAGIPPIL